MIDCHCLSDDDMILICQFFHLIQFITVKCNRLFYQNMFSILNCLFHKFFMCIVRCCDINYINIPISKHLIIIRINFPYAILFTKCDGFFIGSVTNSIDILSVLF